MRLLLPTGSIETNCQTFMRDGRSRVSIESMEDGTLSTYSFAKEGWNFKHVKFCQGRTELQARKVLPRRTRQPGQPHCRHQPDVVLIGVDMLALSTQG
jgi:hypothetical protein